MASKCHFRHSRNSQGFWFSPNELIWYLIYVSVTNFIFQLSVMQLAHAQKLLVIFSVINKRSWPFWMQNWLRCKNRASRIAWFNSGSHRIILIGHLLILQLPLLKLFLVVLHFKMRGFSEQQRVTMKNRLLEILVEFFRNIEFWSILQLVSWVWRAIIEAIQIFSFERQAQTLL